MRSKRFSTGLRTSAASAATVLLTIGATITAATAPATAAAPVAHDDFNGDGYPDLVVSAPGGTVSAKKGAGYVAVLYGSGSGISASRRATFSLSTPGVPGTAQSNDRFGQATASGDLDGDGYADLVVGIPGKDVSSATDAGAALVLWGSRSGLRSTENRWLQDGTPTAKGTFGKSLATGRFTPSGTELAVLTEDDLWTYGFGAARTVQRMSATAVSAPGDEDFTPTALTSGDYNNDGADDVVVMGFDISYYEGQLPRDRTGGAHYLPGGPDGPKYSHGIVGGSTGASGDINNDGYTDLVMGSPADYDLQAHQLMDGGSVDVVLGGPDGPGSPGSAYQYFTQNSPGVPGASFLGDRFGGAIAVGDVNGDGYADATIGAPGNDIDAATDAGTGWVMQGTTTGLTTRGSHTVGQNSPRVPGTPEKGDRFGGALSLIDTNRDGKAELITSAPGEDTNDGAVWVFPAIDDDLPTGGSWFFGGTTLHAPATDARFGETLAP